MKSNHTLLFTFIISSLLCAQSNTPPSLPEAQQIVQEQFGEINFNLLPDDPHNPGQKLSIKKAREQRAQAYAEAEARALANHFPESSRNTPGMWRNTVGIDGRSYQVPNESHPNYRAFVTECDGLYRRIDKNFDKKYTSKFVKFSNQALKKIYAAQNSGTPSRNMLIGNRQRRLGSDIDLTTMDPQTAQAFQMVMETNGLQAKTSEHGLSVTYDAVDYVQWGNENLAQMRQELSTMRPDDPQRAQLERRINAGMGDVEVALSTTGALDYNTRNAPRAKNADGTIDFGPGAVDTRGAKLDLIKKFIQSKDDNALYTKSKVVDKMIRMDIGRERFENDYLRQSANQHTSDIAAQRSTTQALRLEGLPDEVKMLEAEGYIQRRTHELVESYRAGAIKSQVEMDRRSKMGESLRNMADQCGDNPTLARSFLDAADNINQEIAAINRDNAEVHALIRQEDPDLARRLREAEVDAMATFHDDPEAAKEAVTDVDSLRALARSSFEAGLPPAKPWTAVAKKSAMKVIGGTNVVFDKAGDIAGYLGVLDEAAAMEASGKGSASMHITKGFAKEYTVSKLVKKYPKLGSVMQVINVPSTMLSEMETEMDKAAARNGSMTHAKIRAIGNTIMKSTWIGTYNQILKEEGMAEVDNELANGTYSWLNVALRTATRTTGEVTQINTIIRYGVNKEYGVHDKVKEARLAMENLKEKVKIKGLTGEKRLEQLGNQIIRLQMQPNADTPDMQALIAKLQKEHDKTAESMLDTGRKMRKHFMGDKVVDNMYKKVKLARKAQKTNLIEAKLVSVAGMGDMMDAKDYLKLQKLQKQYAKEVKDYQKLCQNVFHQRDIDDPLTKKMLARLRNMKERRDAAANIKFDTKHQMWREVEAEQTARKKELDNFKSQIKAGADRLPSGVDPNDQQLIIEMDDLKIRQQKGEIPENADLVVVAGMKLKRELLYREFEKKQKNGQIAADIEIWDLVDDELPDPEDFLTPEEKEDEETEDAIPQIEEFTVDFTDTGNGVDAGFSFVKQPVQGPTGTYDSKTKTGVKSNTTYSSAVKAQATKETPYLNGKVHGVIKLYNASTGAFGYTYSYQNSKKHGPNTYYNEAGKVRKVEHYKKGKRHGPSLEYWPNGKMKSENWYKNNKLQGWSRNWNEAGTLLYESLRHSVNGKTKTAISRKFDKKTAALLRETLTDVKKTGKDSRGRDTHPEQVREWRNGELYKETRTDENGEFVGERIFYDGGRERVEIRYQSPGIMGQIKAFYESGEPKFEGYFTNGPERSSLLHGKWILYGAPNTPLAEKPQRITHFKDGLADGKFQSWHTRTGKLADEGNSRKGLREGAYVSYDSNGKKKYEFTYDDGAMEGPQKTYKNGKIYYSADITNGKPTRIAEYFSNGKLERERRGTFETKPRSQSSLDIKAYPQRPSSDIRISTGRRETWPYEGAPSECPKVRPKYEYQPIHNAGNDKVPLLNGSLKYWRDAGRGKIVLYEECHYSNKKPHGKRKLYHDNGKLFLDETYSQGIMDGPAKAYFTNGGLAASAVFKDGVLEGPCSQKNSSNYQKADTAQASQGVMVGWIMRYNPDGTLNTISHHTLTDKLKEARLQFVRRYCYPKRTKTSSTDFNNGLTVKWSIFSFGAPHGPTISVSVNSKGEQVFGRIKYNTAKVFTST